MKIKNLKNKNMERPNYKDFEGKPEMFDLAQDAYIDCLEAKLKLLGIGDVIGQSEQLCDGLHSTDFNGKCFKCGEQVFIREPK